MRDHWIIAPRLAITLWCIWQARDLLAAWEHSGYDQYGWIALLVWCLPVFMSGTSALLGAGSRQYGTAMLTAALLLALLGQAGSLHILQHAGLALALASWIPFSPHQLLWLLSSISWMPAFGWIGSRLFFGHILPARLLLALTAAGWLAAVLRSRRMERR
ncbi:hypothetical protein EKD00_08630 [Chlorobium phaeovibrioides]|uniref:Uncharacterized protein n=2 Tax=Chlorobium/Pelodictyon group TaxID=274493 RepID=A0A165LED1_PELLU|nr:MULTISPECIES: hypothetical protein [Chlorobium/Pelodictyon group]KZK73920.1 MAG: hypothetical protein A3K90_06745 [Pelodictyon luteolum]MWV55081.1 hypothetical protein [Chlorobium phaeovibrioides]RTY34164.1 hypothetical protein EKD00_08630 [Chlorobium phaeovibrioides]